ncbi:type VI secretion system contractile sheath small subunit [Citrobacter sp. R-1.5.2]|nr:type VI secretion system contractile sheath small subunit [Citrobacter sp. R-1.5.2]
MADSFQNEVPKARVNLKLDLHTGGASKKTELPLKLLVAGDFSNGQDFSPLSGREKTNITKNNFDAVLSDYSPRVDLTVKNTLADDGSEDTISLTFQNMKDFSPEQVFKMKVLWVEKALYWNALRRMGFTRPCLKKLI